MNISTQVKHFWATFLDSWRYFSGHTVHYVVSVVEQNVSWPPLHHIEGHDCLDLCCHCTKEGNIPKSCSSHWYCHMTNFSWTLLFHQRSTLFTVPTVSLRISKLCYFCCRSLHFKLFSKFLGSALEYQTNMTKMKGDYNEFCVP